MNTRTKITAMRWPVGALALTAILGAGCNHASAPSEDQSVSATYQELGGQLENCVSGALDCLKAANCDAAKDQTCRDDFKTCHDQNKAVFQAFGQAIKTCVDQKHQCLASAGTGGTSAATAGTSGGTGGAAAGPKDACRQAFHGCISDNRPIAPTPGPCMQALHTCMQDSTQQPKDCFDQARTCFINRLPPKCNATGGGLGGHGDHGGHAGSHASGAGGA